MSEHDPNIRQHLIRAFSGLFALYGEGSRFEVAYTGNCVLYGIQTEQYSLWWGQDFHLEGDFGVFMDEPTVVRNLGDVEEIRTDFNVGDFEQAFLAVHADTNVTCDSLVSIVFIIRYWFDNFLEQKKTVGHRIQRLF